MLLVKLLLLVVVIVVKFIEIKFILKQVMNGDNFVYILDYGVGLIFEIELTEADKQLEAEELLDKYGFRTGECSWMFTENKIDNIIEVYE